jgi:hypothetical protein
MKMNNKCLPIEVIKKNFRYMQSPEAEMIKTQIQLYETDHNDDYTKMTGYYLIKNIMSFSDYYFDKFKEPFDYNSYKEEYSKRLYIK